MGGAPTAGDAGLPRRPRIREAVLQQRASSSARLRPWPRGVLRAGPKRRGHLWPAQDTACSAASVSRPTVLGSNRRRPLQPGSPSQGRKTNVSAIPASRGMRSCVSGKKSLFPVHLRTALPCPPPQPLPSGPGDKAMAHACEVCPWGGGQRKTFASDFDVSSSGEGGGNFQKTLERTPIARFGKSGFPKSLPQIAPNSETQTG